MLTPLLGAVLLAVSDTTVLAHEAPGTESVGLLEIVTAIALSSATVFSFWFWYVANKPNVIVKPTFISGSTAVTIVNEGRTPAKHLRVVSASFQLRRDSDETLDISLPALYPKEELKYYAGVWSDAVKQEPYEFNVSHRRWLSRWPTEKRHFTVDFAPYEATLGEIESVGPFENTLTDLARIGHSLIQMHAHKKDRLRYKREILKYRFRQLKERVASRLGKTAKSDG